MAARVPRVGDQLSLWEDDGGRVGAPEIVLWEGRSPRGLTRAATVRILKPSGKKSMSELVASYSRSSGCPDRRRPAYGGAPLLLDLREARDG